MIKFEKMNVENTKGNALGVAYHPKVKTLWLMFWFIMVEIELKKASEK